MFAWMTYEIWTVQPSKRNFLITPYNSLPHHTPKNVYFFKVSQILIHSWAQKYQHYKKLIQYYIIKNNDYFLKVELSIFIVLHDIICIICKFRKEKYSLSVLFCMVLRRCLFVFQYLNSVVIQWMNILNVVWHFIF